ncbi:MAG: peptidoglycan DD-metalloendopeptidase family protein [Treponema sp.]|nr:peptidoglycan DD-metalloendopeptidase family protein [Treponema sp.]
MLVVFRKFAVTKANVKVLAALLILFFTFLILAAQGKGSKVDSNLVESMGGRESAVEEVELVALETSGVLEPEDLTQSQPRMLLFSSYTVQKGEVLGEIAKKFGLSISTLVSVNDIKNTRTVPVGKVLRIPNQDGVFYKIKTGDTLGIIAEKHKANVSEIQASNELFSDKINPNSSLFIPGASTPWEEAPVIVAVSAPRPQVIVSGNIFDWPVRGRITSGYGYRRSPFGRGLHDGLDIGAPKGTPVRAAMAGRVESVGYDNVYGNFVIIRHTEGYKTLYGHLDSCEAMSGAYVDIDSVIGYVGNTGQSTGPHLHFTVYKDGSSVNPRAVLKP